MIGPSILTKLVIFDNFREATLDKFVFTDHFIEIMEDKEVVIESLASFVCDEDDSHDRTFGLKYSSENASVSI